MMKLGKLTDYAIAVMAQLARHAANASAGADGVALSAAALSAETGVPEPTVAKVLKTLSRGQLLDSARGVSGGYRLARDARQITVAEIIEVMDGPIAIVSCVEPASEEGGCTVAHRCGVRSKWAPVNDAIRQALLAVTLADMAMPSCAKIPQATAPLTIKMPQEDAAYASRK